MRQTVLWASPLPFPPSEPAPYQLSTPDSLSPQAAQLFRIQQVQLYRSLLSTVSAIVAIKASINLELLFKLKCPQDTTVPHPPSSLSYSTRVSGCHGESYSLAGVDVNSPILRIYWPRATQPPKASKSPNFTEQTEKREVEPPTRHLLPAKHTLRKQEQKSC